MTKQEYLWHAQRCNGAICRFRSGFMKGEYRAMTYGELLDQLKTMTEEQLAQPAELLGPNSWTDKPALLQPIISIGTVEAMCHVDGEIATETRCCRDFTHRPEQVVLLYDECPFSEDGDTFYTVEADGSLVGNKSGKRQQLGG